MLPSITRRRFRRPKRSTSIAAGVASLFFVAALALDPMGAASGSGWGGLFPIALGLAVIVAASVALVRQERPTLLAFYGLLLTGLDVASRPLAAAGVPDWAPVTLLIAALAVWASTLSGAGPGYAFYLQPDLSKLVDTQTITGAAGQAFFSLSLGMGAMITYASYLPGKGSLPGRYDA